MTANSTPDPTSDQSSSRKRGRYSRLICLGCRARRIRCDLPSQTDIPDPGKVQRVSTPCSRCQRLGTPCVVRQTVLGRPNRERSPGTDSETSSASTTIIAVRIPTEAARANPLPLRDRPSPSHGSITPHTSSTPPKRLALYQNSHARSSSISLSHHKPQSSEGLFILRALETLRREHVQDEWFRHLPIRYGHTLVLDLSIQALVTACAYSRSMPGVTSRDCYIALSMAVAAVHGAIEQPDSDPDDHLLASTALLVPFEGVIQKTGIQTRLHAEGLAALLGARSNLEPPSQLTRDILDFQVCEAGVMACFQDKPSPFEVVPLTYFRSGGVGYSTSALTRLKCVTNELFTRLPRLGILVRTLKQQDAFGRALLSKAWEVVETLLELQDPQAEALLLQDTEVQPSSESNSCSFPGNRMLFPSIQHYEALAYYWQGRLSLMRLACQLEELASITIAQLEQSNELPTVPQHLEISHLEMSRLASSILLCSDFARTLPLFKHHRMLAHAMVLLWGVMRDMPEAIISVGAESGEVSKMAAILLGQVNWALLIEPELVTEDMDVAASVLVGGIPCGRVAQLYGS